MQKFMILPWNIEMAFPYFKDDWKKLPQRIKDLESGENYIVVPHSEKYPVEKTIEVCGVRQFIQECLPHI